MECLVIRKLVENYKKTQLYAINTQSVKESIISELRQDLEDYQTHILNQQECLYLLAKIIAYLEFGFPYETYRTLFDTLLVVCGETKVSLYTLVDREAQYIKASKANLRKLIIWKSGQSSRYPRKGDVVTDMFTAIKGRNYGVYTYETEFCKYTLTVSEDVVVLENIYKEILYYLI